EVRGDPLGCRVGMLRLDQEVGRETAHELILFDRERNALRARGAAALADELDERPLPRRLRDVLVHVAQHTLTPGGVPPLFFETVPHDRALSLSRTHTYPCGRRCNPGDGVD